MMKIHDLLVLLSGNQREICIEHHFLSDIIAAVRFDWRIRHLRGKQSKTLGDFRLPPYVNEIFPLLGFYAPKIGSSETTFRDNMTVLSSRIKVFLN